MAEPQPYLTGPYLNGEVLPPLPSSLRAEADGARLICCPSPFTSHRLDVVMGADQTVLEMIETAEIPPELWDMTHVHVQDGAMARDAEHIPQGLWPWVKPKPGALVYIRVAPMKGGRKNPLAAILGLVGAAALFFLAAPLGAALFPSLTSVTLFGQTVNLASALGGLIIGAAFKTLSALILPPPEAPNISLPQQEDPRFGFSGQSNRIDRYGPVLRVFGRHKVMPRLAAYPVTEGVGFDHYQTLLLDFGYGPLRLDDIRLGAVRLQEFEDVEYHIHENYDGSRLNLWTNTILEDSYSLALPAGQPQVVSTRADAIGIGYDFLWQGIGRIRSWGLAQHVEEIDVEYRREGDSTDEWTFHARHTIGARTRNIWRRGFRIFGLEEGRYELRFTKVDQGPFEDPNMILDDAFLSVVRTIRWRPKPYAPLTVTGRTLLELRIRASDQANGVLDQITAIAHATLPVWTGTAWVEQETRHPAWAILDVLRGSASPRPVPDSRLDLAAFKAWADAEPDRTLDIVLDGRSTVADTVRLLASAARVRVLPLYGIWTVIRDVPRERVQVFTPRNTFGLKVERTLNDPPHAVRAQFLNPERDYEPGEIVIYRDGYDAGTATRFAEQPMRGQTDPDQIYRDVRYHQAVTDLRPEVFTFGCDLAHLMCDIGDRVGLQSDVLLIGLGGGRVKSRAESGGQVTAITLDAQVPMEAGKSYGLAYAKEDSAEGAVATVQTEQGEHSTLTLSPALAPTDAPAVGGLVAFGEAGQEVQDLIVTRKRHKADFQAELECVPYAPAVFDAANEPIPPYEPVLTNDPRLVAPGLVQGLIVRETVRFVFGRAVSDVTASWQPPLTGVPVRYRVYTDAESTDRLTQVAETDSLTALVMADQPCGLPLTVAVVAVSSAGQTLPQAQWARQSITVECDTEPPVAVQNVRVEEVAGTGLRRIRWSYNLPPADLAGFFVRVRPGSETTWSQGTPLNTFAVPASPLETLAIPAGTQTVMVRAMDTSGNLSPVASATVTVQAAVDPGAQNLIVTTDYRAGGWAGTIENATVDGDGSLLGDLSQEPFYLYMALPFYGGAEQAFYGLRTEVFYQGMDDPLYGAPAETFYEGVYPELVYTDTFTTASGGQLLMSVEGTGDITLEWRPQGTMEWVPFSHRARVDAGTYDVRVRVLPSTVRADLTLFQVHIDVPDIIERVNDAATASGGSRLTLSQTFTAIANVTVTVQEVVGETAVTARVVDKSTSGPLIQCYDAAGAAVAGTVDATVQGY